MSVFLSVLTFILKIFLWILAIIVIFIAVILLCGIRYRINCVYNDDNKLNAEINISWLWKLVVFRYLYQNDNGETFFRIGWKRIVDSKKIAESESEPQEEKSFSENEAADVEATAGFDIGEKAEEEIESKKYYQNDNNENHDKKENKISTYFNRIKEVYNYSDRSEIIEESKKFIIRFWRSIKPKEFILNCNFGFSSPDTTGYILAFTGMMTAYMRKNHVLNVTGDFDKEIFNIDLYIKGKTSFFKLLIPLGRYVISKPIWKIVKTKFKK